MFQARRPAPNNDSKRKYARQWGRVPALEPLEYRTLLNGGGLDASHALPLLIDEQFAEMAIDGDRIPTIENHRPNDALALKISSRLWQATELLAQHDENAFAQIPESRRDANGAVLVTMRVDANNATVSRTLATMGLEITSQRSDYDGRAELIEGWLPLASVRAAAAMPTVRSIVIPSKLTSQTGSVTSAGDAALNADDVRSQFAALGIDGSGIRIGVISTGVTNRSAVQGDPNNDLPATITIDATRPGIVDDEGTAMLEIVHDLAPGAALYFSGPGTPQQFADSIDWLVNQQVDIIVDDLLAFDEPYFEDGIVAQAAASAVTSGVVYVSAAGNHSLDHYQVAYNQGPSSSNGFWHDFDPTAGVNIGQIVDIPPDGEFHADLQWSDPFGASNNNYDLYLFRLSDNDELARSLKPQNGAEAPYEDLEYTNPSSTDSLLAYVTINRRSGSARELELWTFGDTAQQYTTPGDAVFGHPAVEAVLAVGAINAGDPAHDDMAIYSQQGPSTIYTDFATQSSVQRNTLDGAGIDGVETRIGQLGGYSNPFFGTSAAAPHVAAIAALMLEVNPSLTPAQVQAALQETAVDIETAGYDHQSGFGRFDALAAVYKVFTPPAADLTPGSDTGASDSDDVTRDTTPTFSGTVPADSFVRLYVDGNEQGTQQLSGGATTYSITAAGPLSDGSRAVTIRVGESDQTPVANLSNASVPLAIMIDTGPLGQPSKTPDEGATIYSDTIVVDVTFLEEVFGVEAEDLVLSGVGGATATVDEVNRVGQSNTWKFEISGLELGLVNLSLAPVAGDITDLAGNNLAQVDWSYTASVPTAAVLSLAAPLATEVELTWTDAVGESDYYIYDGAYLATVAANSTSYTVTGLVPDTQHDFMVVAHSSLGTTNSGPYQQIDTPALVAPTFELEAVAPNSVRVDWEDSNGETAFYIYRFNYDSNDNPVGSPPYTYLGSWPSGVGPRSVTFNFLSANRLVGYQVKAVAPSTTAQDPQQTVRTPKANAPVLTVTPLTPSSVKLDWLDSAGEESFAVYPYTYDANGDNETEGTSWSLGTNVLTDTVTGLTPGTWRGYRVVAVYPAPGVNVDSEIVKLLLPEENEPVVTATIVSATQVKLDWNDSSGETSYYIYRFDYDQTGSTGYTFLGTFGADTIEHTDSNLNADWYYEYQVKAVYAGGTVDSDRVSARTPAALLLAEADRVQEPADPTVANDERLAPLVVEAIRRWEAAGVDPLVVARLEETEVRIENLPEDFLGLAYSDSGVIILDDDAAGRGWFIDPTPADDEEFSDPSRHAEMIALPRGPAADAVDLLTAVMHEMGHVLGFGHEGGHYSMSETLASGVRRLPHFDEPTPIYDLAEERGPGGFVHRLPEPVPALDGSGRSIVAYRLESEDDLLWAIYRRDVGEQLGFADPAAALDEVMAEWGQGN